MKHLIHTAAALAIAAGITVLATSAGVAAPARGEVLCNLQAAVSDVQDVYECHNYRQCYKRNGKEYCHEWKRCAERIYGREKRRAP